MFLDDDSYPKLEDALKKENVEEAFRAAHTLKGVCQNLGFTNLYQPAYELTEVLRAGTLEGSKEWFDRVTERVNIHDRRDPRGAVTAGCPRVMRRII